MKHEWANFSNPRNQTVKVQACMHCGIVKSPVSIKARKCMVLDDSEHAMRRLGWIEVNPLLQKRVANFG